MGRGGGGGGGGGGWCKVIFMSNSTFVMLIWGCDNVYLSYDER